MLAASGPRMALFQAYIRRAADKAAMVSARQAVEHGDRARALDVLGPHRPR
jgi:hypothetical protein